MVRYIVMQFDQVSPAAWGLEREREGWQGVGVGDHWWLPNVDFINHPFVALGAIAAATNDVAITTLFINNLVRSPVDVAQMAATVQYISGGRFTLGFGAGWARDELLRAGLEHPAPAERARRFKEAVQVVRGLLTDGCQFEGEFYRIDLPSLRSAEIAPPPIAAALGGPWMMRHVGPLVDVIEVAPMGPSTRLGINDYVSLSTFRRDDLRRLHDLAREANPGAAIGVSLNVTAGTGRAIDHFASLYVGSAFEGLAGEPRHVADALDTLAETGFDSITVIPVACHPETIAAELFC